MLSLKLEFLVDPPVKHNFYIPQNSCIPQFPKESAIDLEIQKLLAKDVITKCEHETGEEMATL